jgi:ribose-phosphate pyrophosphokinase
MIKLHLISYPEHDEKTIVVTPTIFPDKTSQVWKLPDFVFYDHYRSYTIVWDFENESELIHVLQLAKLIGVKTNIAPNLFMPYLPYGRQDKTVSNETTFALRIFIEVLKNSRDFANISTLDAHNTTYCKLLGIQNIEPTEQIKFAIDAVNPDYIVFPDKGASNRGYNVQGLKTIVLDKVRNQLTGEIEGLKIPVPLDITDAKLLIVDDLCDGGRTFIEATNLLKALDAKEVSLYTTHGLYSKGTKILFDAGIDRIFDKSGEIK